MCSIAHFPDEKDCGKVLANARYNAALQPNYSSASPPDKGGHEQCPKGAAPLGVYSGVIPASANPFAHASSCRLVKAAISSGVEEASWNPCRSIASFTSGLAMALASS